MKNLILFLLLTLFSCSDDIHSPQTPSEPVSNPYSTPNFSFHFTSLDSSNILSVADTLERNYLRIINDLDSDSLPQVNVHFYTNYSDLAEAVSHVVPNLPLWAIGLAISETEIHMLSPNVSGLAFGNMLVNLIHEFAHCVSYRIKPNIANNPRWLWESVAIYEAGQFRDPHTIPYLVSHDPPGLTQLNSFDNTMIYEVGYLISEYIILNWGRTQFVNLILTNGDLQQVLGINAAEFQNGWFEFVMKRYGI